MAGGVHNGIYFDLSVAVPLYRALLCAALAASIGEGGGAGAL